MCTPLKFSGLGSVGLWKALGNEPKPSKRARCSLLLSGLRLKIPRGYTHNESFPGHGGLKYVLQQLLG